MGKLNFFFLSWEVCPEPLRSHCERHPLPLAVVEACGSLLSGTFIPDGARGSLFSREWSWMDPSSLSLGWTVGHACTLPTGDVYRLSCLCLDTCSLSLIHPRPEPSMPTQLFQGTPLMTRPAWTVLSLTPPESQEHTPLPPPPPAGCSFSGRSLP